MVALMNWCGWTNQSSVSFVNWSMRLTIRNDAITARNVPLCSLDNTPSSFFVSERRIWNGWNVCPSFFIDDKNFSFENSYISKRLTRRIIKLKSQSIWCLSIHMKTIRFKNLVEFFLVNKLILFCPVSFLTCFFCLMSIFIWSFHHFLLEFLPIGFQLQIWWIS